MTNDFRALLLELADALDHNCQCLMDDRSLTHPLAARARAALAAPPPRPVPVAEPASNVRYEFSVFNGEDEWQAGGEAPTLEQAQREGRHYLVHYEADEEGPYRLELREVRMLPAHAIPLPQEDTDV